MVFLAALFCPSGFSLGAEVIGSLLRSKSFFSGGSSIFEEKRLTGNWKYKCVEQYDMFLSCVKNGSSVKTQIINLAYLLLIMQVGIPNT